MTPPLSKKTVGFLKSPPRDLLYTISQLRHLLFAGIAAVALAGTIGILWLLFSFFMEPDLLMLLFRPLIVAAPLTAIFVAALMAFDYSKLDQSWNIKVKRLAILFAYKVGWLSKVDPDRKPPQVTTEVVITCESSDSS